MPLVSTPEKKSEARGSGRAVEKDSHCFYVRVYGFDDADFYPGPDNFNKSNEMYTVAGTYVEIELQPGGLALRIENRGKGVYGVDFDGNLPDKAFTLFGQRLTWRDLPVCIRPFENDKGDRQTYPFKTYFGDGYTVTVVGVIR